MHLCMKRAHVCVCLSEFGMYSEQLLRNINWNWNIENRIRINKQTYETSNYCLIVIHFFLSKSKITTNSIVRTNENLKSEASFEFNRTCFFRLCFQCNVWQGAHLFLQNRSMHVHAIEVCVILFVFLHSIANGKFHHDYNRNALLLRISIELGKKATIFYCSRDGIFQFQFECKHMKSNWNKTVIR